MELNDAITHAREVAREKRAEEQEWRNKKDFIESNERNPKGIYDLPINQCKECAAEHEQLAAWLTELQERREADDISCEGMTVSEALHDLENCILPIVGGKSIRIAIKALKAICDRRKRYESEAENAN